MMGVDIGHADMDPDVRTRPDAGLGAGRLA